MSKLIFIFSVVSIAIIETLTIFNAQIIHIANKFAKDSVCEGIYTLYSDLSYIFVSLLMIVLLTLFFKKRIDSFGINNKKYNLLIGLILIDFLLLFLHRHSFLIWSATGLDFNIYFERSIPEFFQYFKAICISVILFLVYKRSKNNFYLVFSFIYLFVAFDDCFAFHENMGSKLTELMDFSYFCNFFATTAQNIGELVVFLIIALVMSTLLLKCYLIIKPEDKITFLKLVFLLFFLFIFGVLVDFIHSIEIFKKFSFFGVVEDFGEMIVLSITTSFAYRLVIKKNY